LARALRALPPARRAAPERPRRTRSRARLRAPVPPGRPPGKFSAVPASRPRDEETPAVSTEALPLLAPEGTPGLTALGRLRAARRTFVVLAEVLDVSVVAPGVRAVTRRPRRESIEIGDVPAELV